MDNLFEYLFILFIIISFLSSYFDKKKKAQRKKNASGRTQVNIPAAKQQQPQRDILEELFGVKQNPVPPQMPQLKENAEVINKTLTDLGAQENKTWNPEDEFKDVTLSPSENVMENIKKKMEQEDAPMTYSSLEKSAAKEMKMYRKIEVPNLYESDIKARLKEPKTLKEFIIVSELLGKPKALRR